MVVFVLFGVPGFILCALWYLNFTSGSFIVGLLCSIIGMFYVYRKNYLQLFKRLGIPGPSPHWLAGNFAAMNRTDRHMALAEWSEKYGDYYGMFEGSSPVLIISNIDMIRQVCVKQFENFPGHRKWPFQPDAENGEDVHLLLANGHRWKRLRGLVNANFTSGKLKLMTNVMAQCQTRFLEACAAANSQPSGFDIYGLYQKMTLDTISECCFGIETRTKDGVENPILDRMNSLFHQLINLSPTLITGVIIPELDGILRRMDMFLCKNSNYKGQAHPTVWLSNIFAKIIEERVDSNGKLKETKDSVSGKIDMLETMLANNQLCDSYAQVKRLEEGLTESTKLPMVTRREVAAQCFLFLVAGYETTSNALAFATWSLVKHSDIQEKLVSEIKQLVDGDYEDVVENEAALLKLQDCEYMTWVCWETLRLYPIANDVVNRLCVKTTTIAPDVTVPAGVNVVVDSWTVNRKRSLWGEDADEFRPERWEGRQSDATNLLMSFGYGPRSCVGARFAMKEMRMTLALMLLRYRIEGGEKFEHDKVTIETGVTLTPQHGIHVRLIPRH